MDCSLDLGELTETEKLIGVIDGLLASEAWPSLRALRDEAEARLLSRTYARRSDRARSFQRWSAHAREARERIRGVQTPGSTGGVGQVQRPVISHHKSPTGSRLERPRLHSRAAGR